MKFEISKIDLVKALSAAASSVGKRVVQPILGGVLLQAREGFAGIIEFTGTDLDTTCRTTAFAVVQDGGACVLDAKHVLASVKAWDKDARISVELNASVNTIQFRSGYSYFSSPAIGSADDFPNMSEAPALNALRLTPIQIATILDKVSIVCSTYDTRSILNGVLFDVDPQGSKFVATDGSRLVCYDPCRVTTNSTGKGIVPLSALKLFGKARATLREKCGVDVTFDKDQMTLSGDDMTVTTRLIQGDYPCYHELFPNSKDGYREFKRTELLAACKQASAADKHLNVIVIAGIEVGSKCGTFRAGPQGSSSDSMAFALNSNYLGQWLDAIKDDYVRLEIQANGALKPIMLVEKQDDVRHLLMPVSTLTNWDGGKNTPINGWWSAIERKVRAS